MSRSQAALARRVREERRRERETFLGFLERRGLPPPAHLRPLVAALDGAAPGFRMGIVMPPGGAKSVSITNYVCQRTGRRPTSRTILCSYSTRLARHHVRSIRAMLLEEGVQLDRDGSSTSLLRTAAGGYVAAASLAGGLATGLRADLVVVDDVFAGRVEAESVAMRDRAWNTITSTLLPRLEPRTGDFLLGSTDWHTDSPIGRLRNGTGASWQWFHVPAITPEGDSFWPERFPIEKLIELREQSPRDFAALYQGQPIDDGGQLFRGVTLTSEEPPKGATISLGLDCGYTAKTSSDPTVAIALAHDAASRRTWIVDVLWLVGGLEETAPRLAAFSQRFGGAAFEWAASGTEAAVVAPVLRERGVPVRVTIAVADKVSRAQRAGAAWCEGRILVPRGLDARERLVRELLGFPSARHDDAVDALASAYDSVAGGWVWDGQSPVAVGAGYRSTSLFFDGGGSGPTRPSRHGWW